MLVEAELHRQVAWLLRLARFRAVGMSHGRSNRGSQGPQNIVTDRPSVVPSLLQERADQGSLTALHRPHIDYGSDQGTVDS